MVPIFFDTCFILGWCIVIRFSQSQNEIKNTMSVPGPGRGSDQRSLVAEQFLQATKFPTKSVIILEMPHMTSSLCKYVRKRQLNKESTF